MNTFRSPSLPIHSTNRSRTRTGFIGISERTTASLLVRNDTTRCALRRAPASRTRSPEHARHRLLRLRQALHADSDVTVGARPRTTGTSRPSGRRCTSNRTHLQHLPDGFVWKCGAGECASRTTHRPTSTGLGMLTCRSRPAQGSPFTRPGCRRRTIAERTEPSSHRDPGTACWTRTTLPVDEPRPSITRLRLRPFVTSALARLGVTTAPTRPFHGCSSRRQGCVRSSRRALNSSASLTCRHAYPASPGRCGLLLRRLAGLYHNPTRKSVVPDHARGGRMLYAVEQHVRHPHKSGRGLPTPGTTAVARLPMGHTGRCRPAFTPAPLANPSMPGGLVAAARQLRDATSCPPAPAPRRHRFLRSMRTRTTLASSRPGSVQPTSR